MSEPVPNAWRRVASLEDDDDTYAIMGKRVTCSSRGRPVHKLVIEILLYWNARPRMKSAAFCARAAAKTMSVLSFGEDGIDSGLSGQNNRNENQSRWLSIIG